MFVANMDFAAGRRILRDTRRLQQHLIDRTVAALRQTFNESAIHVEGAGAEARRQVVAGNVEFRVLCGQHHIGIGPSNGAVTCRGGFGRGGRARCDCTTISGNSTVSCALACDVSDESTATWPSSNLRKTRFVMTDSRTYQCETASPAQNAGRSAKRQVVQEIGGARERNAASGRLARTLSTVKIISVAAGAATTGRAGALAVCPLLSSACTAQIAQ